VAQLVCYMYSKQQIIIYQVLSPIIYIIAKSMKVVLLIQSPCNSGHWLSLMGDLNSKVPLYNHNVLFEPTHKQDQCFSAIHLEQTVMASDCPNRTECFWICRTMHCSSPGSQCGYYLLISERPSTNVALIN